MDKNNLVIFIPAYNPDAKLLNLTYELMDRDFKNILIINDGSTLNSQSIFKELQTFKNVEVKDIT